jgi:predicted RNase H-like nuclease
VAVLGVDGWRGRWVGARLEGRRVTLGVLPDAAAVLAEPDVEVVAIDMPIGLSDDGPRACDVAARTLVGRAGSTVFPAPGRRRARRPGPPDADRVVAQAPVTRRTAESGSTRSSAETGRHGHGGT